MFIHFSKREMTPEQAKKAKIIGIIVGSVIIVTIIIVVIVVVTKKDKQSYHGPLLDHLHDAIINDNPLYGYGPYKRREGFFNAANDAYVSNSGTLHGTHLFTDQSIHNMTNKEFADAVRADKNYADDDAFGAVPTTGLDALYKNQLEIQKINSRTGNQVMKESDMKQISKKLMSSSNNSKYNMYDRSGAVNARMRVEPWGTRAVIDGDYRSGRADDHQIASVRRVIPVKAWDMPIDRAPEWMSMMGKLNSASFQANKKTVRRAGDATMTEANGTEIIEQPIDTSSDKTVVDSFARSGNMVVGNSLK